jgi:hypothetical protein
LHNAARLLWGRKQRFKLRHYRKALAKAIAAAPECPASGNAM